MGTGQNGVMGVKWGGARAWCWGKVGRGQDVVVGVKWGGIRTG